MRSDTVILQPIVRNMPIPLEDFFRNPEKTGFNISPDGKYISWLAGYENRLNIFIRGIHETEPIRLTGVTDKDILHYLWLNNHQIGILKDNNGDENHHLFVIDIHDKQLRDFTPFENVKVDVVDELEEDDDAVLIQMNRRDPAVFDVYRLNTNSGELTLVEENPGNITGWITDHAGTVRMAITTDGVNTSLLFREGASGVFTNLLTTSFREGINPLFFDFDNKNIYALSNIGRNTIAIVEFDPLTVTEKRILFEHPEVDADLLGYSKKRKTITLATYTTWKKEFHFFDEISRQRYEKLNTLIQGEEEIYITSRNREENIFIVRTLSDRSLGNYYLFIDATGELIHLANVSPWLPSESLSAMQPIQYQTRDGLTVNGYLTQPSGNISRPCPLIVNPHGGPWVRDIWRFNPEVQFLASRGFTVLQMNYRGSTGYGKKFWEAGFKQWGKKMQDDITDGVEYLIEQGIADKNRIGIYGGSYGGYAVLAGLTFTPDLYACGVDYVGVSNLFTFMKTIPPYWKPYLDMMYEMVGNPETEKELLASATPLFHIDNIKAPLLVAQGAKDPRVNKAESDQIVDALREKNVEVEYLVKENEGHGFTNQENKFEFYRAMERFFEIHLN